MERRRDEGKGDDAKLRGQPGTKSLDLEAFKVFARNYRPPGADTVRQAEGGDVQRRGPAGFVRLRRLSTEEALMKGAQQKCGLVGPPF